MDPKKHVDSNSNAVINFVQFKVQGVVTNRSKLCTVAHDCELREYVEKQLEFKFWRGCIFYELQHEFKNITEDKELVIGDKEVSTMVV